MTPFANYRKSGIRKMQFSRISDFYYRQEITYDIFDVTQQHTLAAVTLQITARR